MQTSISPTPATTGNTTADTSATGGPVPRPDSRAAAPASVAALAVAGLTTACGGGGGGDAATSVIPAAPPSREQAARFLAQASLAATPAEAARVQAVGYAAWLDEQMALPRSSSHVEWLRAQGLAVVANKNNQTGADAMVWRKLIAGADPLRQRVTLALSELVVVSVAGIANTSFRQFAAAAFLDILEANAFGSYRALLEQVSTSVAMGGYLTFKGGRKANPASGSLPDENYARELMQLFTVGLVQLNADGSAKLGSDGQPLETYAQADVSGLARVFTGWETDTSLATADEPDRVVAPMVQIAARHESGEKRFLGTVIPAGTDGVRSLQLALDALVAHPNMGPFIGRQLIQRLVTSQPSPPYVARVAAAFDNNGAGARGELRAVVRAVLLDPEARGAAGLDDPAFGKLREPVLRFVQWARSFGLADSTDQWRIGDLSDPATKLGQSPLRAPSVFNFFRPGYVPPNTGIGARTAPEFQITTESSVAGYLNFIQGCIGNGIAGLRADDAALRPLVADPAALLAELNLLLAAGQLSAPTLAALKTALDTVAVATPAGIDNRLRAAVMLVMASPEYIAQK